MFYRTAIKFFLLLGVLLGVVVTGIILFQQTQREHLQKMFYANQEMLTGMFTRLVELKGSLMEVVAYDYTYWDEMVEAIKSRDRQFFDENIAQALSSYKMDAAWVYDDKAELVYMVQKEGRERLREVFFIKQAQEMLEGEKRFCHFFIPTSIGLMEVRGATVHPTRDPERRLPPQGVFFVSRVWDSVYLRGLREMINGEVSLRPAVMDGSEEKSDINKGVIVINHPLNGSDDSVVGNLQLKYICRLVLAMRQEAPRRLWLLLGVGILMIGAVGIGFWRWVERPLDRISLALKENDARRLAKLISSRSEFGKIARLIESFFIQEKVLREEKKRAQQYLDIAKVIILVLDRAGRVVLINREGCNLLGYKEEEIIGKDWFDCFLPPLLRDKTKDVFRHLIVGDVAHFIDWENPIVTRTGEERIIRWRNTVVRGELGEILGTLSSGEDITERKRAEAALQERTEELKRSNRELEHFAYIASHDLQEPLRMVGSYVSLLARRYRGKLDGDADEFINYAVDGVTRMQRLINDLLTYSRIGTRGKPLQPTDSEMVLRRVLMNLKISIEEKRASVTYDRLPVVIADERQLEQLLQNLISNAIKFSDSEPKVHVGVRAQDGYWVFAVKDNGIGIEPQFSDKVFQIFQRGVSRDKYPGTGIGLAVCKRIVERHGGKIWFESEPGKGTTFFFTLIGVEEQKTKEG